jgi:hypothetical protein
LCLVVASKEKRRKSQGQKQQRLQKKYLLEQRHDAKISALSSHRFVYRPWIGTGCPIVSSVAVMAGHGPMADRHASIVMAQEKTRWETKTKKRTARSAFIYSACPRLSY